MPNYSKIIIAGHCGADAEVRYTPKGTALATFSIAVSERRGDVEHTNWFRCSMFGERAEKMAPFIVKGSPYLVEGRPRFNRWTDDNGTKHERFELNVSNIEFLAPRGNQSSRRREDWGDGDPDPDDQPFS